MINSVIGLISPLYAAADTVLGIIGYAGGIRAIDIDLWGAGLDVASTYTDIKGFEKYFGSRFTKRTAELIEGGGLIFDGLSAINMMDNYNPVTDAHEMIILMQFRDLMVSETRDELGNKYALGMRMLNHEFSNLDHVLFTLSLTNGYEKLWMSDEYKQLFETTLRQYSKHGDLESAWAYYESSYKSITTSTSREYHR